MHRSVRRLIPLAVALVASSALVAGCGGDDTKTVGSITVLYRTDSVNSKKIFQVLQQELGAAGIEVKGLGAPVSDLYTKYLQKPDVAQKGTWDIAIAGWGPDWYGNSAPSFFLPLLNGKAAFPPTGSNFGFYDNEATNKLIQQASTSADPAEATKLWQQADRQTMEDAAFYPITDPQQANYASKNISDKVYVAAFQNYDISNVTKTGKDADTLHVLGVSDVDYMDPNITYFSTGYEAARLYSRQLLTFPAIEGKSNQPAPDLATAIPSTKNGGVSADGKTVTIHLRGDAKWNTSPERTITADDVVRGVKRTCNPVQPFGGSPDYSTLIKGFEGFCKALAADAGAKPTVASIKKGMENPLSGVVATNPTTVVFHLNHPATYFTSMLTLPAFSPAPVESLDYLPASAEAAQHTISSGPYQIDKYTPTKQIVFTPNPSWTQGSDPIRKQKFKTIIVNETGSQDSIQQQLQTGTSTADMEWDTFPPVTDINTLHAAGDPNLTINGTESTNPYLIFNTVSPNNNAAMSKVEFRQALSQTISRDALIKVIGGELLNKPLAHVLPFESIGSLDFDLYPYDPKKAKSKIADILK